MENYRKFDNTPAFRKLAAAMWKAPNDPHIYGTLDVDISETLKFIERYSKATNCKITITHVMVRVIALVFKKYPELNALVTWKELLLRNHIDIFCQVASDDGRELSGVKIRDVDQLSIAEIATKLKESAERIRKDDDPEFKKSRNIFKLYPLYILRFLLKFMSFLVNTLHLHLPKLGMPRDPFGSAMVTSVGMFKIDTGFAPFTPIARCPIILALTQIKKRPWVENDTVVVKPVLRICATSDHRIIDGFSAGRISTYAEELLYHPEKLLTSGEINPLSRLF